MTGITSGVVDEPEALQEGYGNVERNVSKGCMAQDRPVATVLCSGVAM